MSRSDRIGHRRFQQSDLGEYYQPPIHVLTVLWSVFLPLSSMTDACKPAALLPYSISYISTYAL